MSEIKVNKISPRANCGTVQLGDSGDTITIPAGATITNNGTQTGFGRTGAVNWQTTVKTGDFTATSTEGYFINTAGGAVTVTLPGSPSAGAIVGISDYNSSSKTNDITIARNGSNINGAALNLKLTKANSAVQLVYVDATTGWQNITTANPLDLSNPFMEATGGCESTCGDYKIHTFNGPGTFTVSKISCVAAENTVSYLVVGGGGSGGVATSNGGGGGGGGGFREYKGPADCYTASPLNGNPGGTAVTVTATSFPITVGAGGAGSPSGTRGGSSVFSTITSTGGGGGHTCSAGPNQPGGSGGGVAYATPSAGGTGNTPPVSPPQGQPAGTAATHPTNFTGSGGGGATGAGGNGGPGPAVGGVGATTNINGSPTAFSGGGGGGAAGPTASSGGAASPCGTGGAGKAKGAGTGDNGTTNRGGGGGSAGFPGPAGANGGSGIVIIRYKFQ